MPKGYVNIQQSKFGKYTGYYTGGDIHPTIESAQAVADKNTVAQATIEYELKGVKECTTAKSVDVTTPSQENAAPCVAVKSSRHKKVK